MSDKINNIIISLLVVVTIALSVLIYLMFTGKISLKIKENSSEKNNTIIMANKINDKKDWVYNAPYKRNVKQDSYTTYNCETYYAKDIVVPFINIDSNYANKINDEVKEIFDAAIIKYNDGVEDKLTFVSECDYRKYLYDNALSVLLTYGYGRTDVVRPIYYTYNIDLKTGSELSYEDIYPLAGFNANNIEEKVEETIKKVMNEILLTFEEEKEEKDKLINQSIQNYKKAVEDKTLKYFLDDDEKLNIIVTLVIPVHFRERDTIITID